MDLCLTISYGGGHLVFLIDTKESYFVEDHPRLLIIFLSTKDEKYVDYSSNFQIVLEACLQIIHFLIKQFQKSTNIFI